MTNSTDTSTILIVDDEEGIRYFLERFLTREGFQVVTASSGEAALVQLATTEFDVVLLDLKMRGIGGLDVLADLRQRWPATSVIILTAHASLESAVEALRCGAHDYLFKPCRTLDLRESIRSGLVKRRELLQLRQLTSNSSVPEPPAGSIEPAPADRFLQHSGLIVDPIRHIVTLDGMLLELSPTEFDLLAYLVSEAPRVVSPQELIREVQGYATDAAEAAETIRSHMYHIRRKMQTTVGHSVIHTVRGIGYTLTD
ncbi:MAG TPA: response regulator transcription factor [Anaerolineae bacterium]|nr:response regulator transcription factor [Anaerolineae bacterium]